MINGTLLFVIALCYLALLFGIAYYGDLRARGQGMGRARPVIYSLSLAVYCTSWTFYGNVGTAASQGWNFVPIYLGPVLFLVLFAPFLRRLIRAAKRHNVTSIADFIASRYGKAQALAVLVTVIAVVGILPYIALQLKAVASAYTALTASRIGGGAPAAGQAQGPWGDTALVVALMMAGFSILFGTRSVDTTESHPGMVLAIAFESLVKLAAFLVIGAFVTFSLFGGPDLLWQRAAQDPRIVNLYSGSPITPGFVNDTLLAMASMICLPRLFHVGVVENADAGDVATARWLFPTYMVLFSLFVIPIAVAGLLLFPGGTIAPDSFVLNVPLAAGRSVLTVLAFIGGLSASTGMVIVATIALSTMVCNDIVMPLLLRLPAFKATHPHGRDLSPLLLGIRRVTIVALALLGYVYYLLVAEYSTLASTGLLSFAALAQCAPAIIAGVYWRRANRKGVFVGLVAGFLVWCYTLLLPLLAHIGLASTTLVDQGPDGIAWLRPQDLFGLDAWSPLVNGVFCSLAVNALALVLISLSTRQDLRERVQAVSFTRSRGPRHTQTHWAARSWSATIHELESLLGRFLGGGPAKRAFAAYGTDREAPLRPGAPVDSALVDYTEHVLSGVLGASSARLLLESALSGREVPIPDVVNILDQTSQVIQFNQELLQTTLENISQGVSVIDSDLHLVAWNRRYLELFDYPDGLVRVGVPVAELVRYNARRGECGPGDVEEHVTKRLAHWRAGHPHVFERVRADGTVLEMRGNPLPGGGFVTTFADITEYKRNETALKEMNQTLEQRVAARTRELSQANAALAAAKSAAERANRSKTQFLAAAGHDLLQPLHAARLFNSALLTTPEAQRESAIAQLDNALRSAEDLLGALLDTSRLDAGVLEPNVRVFGVERILSNLADEFGVVAAERGIAFRWVPSRALVRSDLQLLRRIVQNFLSNAVRYTRHGGVLLGCRRQGQDLRIEVWDTGPGIRDEQLEHIFEEFRRFDDQVQSPSRGLGLGLSISNRMAEMLGHRITVRSEPDRGTVFGIVVPRVSSQPMEASAPLRRPRTPLTDTRVLCIDDDVEILDAMHALMTGWGCEVRTARDAPTARQHLHEPGPPPDVVLADYHLEGALEGVTLLAELRRIAGRDLPGIIITADPDETVRAEAIRHGCECLRKPVRPAALRALVTRLLQASPGKPGSVGATGA